MPRETGKGDNLFKGKARRPHGVRAFVCDRRNAGFTLVELLLVVVIIAIATGIAIPYFARSYKGAKLRSSARSIVMGSRYARSVSVLDQAQAALLLNTKGQSIEVVTVGSATTADDRDKFLEGVREPAGDDAADEEKPAPNVASKLKRSLAEGVKIVSVTTENEGRHEIDGIFWINYYPNGMCDEFAVKLQDEENKVVTLEVDPMSGRAEVNYDW